MKRINFLLALIMMSHLCFTQSTCNVSDITKKIRSYIQQDEEKSKNSLILEPLTLSINTTYDNNSGSKVHHIFSYNAGFTFCFYILSSDSFGNDAILKLYRRIEEDDEVKVILLDSASDKSRDNKPTVLKYNNDQVTDFYLELSLEEDKPGCAAVMVTVNKTK